MIEYCNQCKKDTDHAVVKPKKGSGGVYCMGCFKKIRPITPKDKKYLQLMDKRTWKEKGYIYDDITGDH